MHSHSQSDIEYLAERVRRHIEAENMYVRERREAFGLKQRSWLTEAIRRALLKINGWVDESLVGPIRRLLLKKGI